MAKPKLGKRDKNKSKGLWLKGQGVQLMPLLGKRREAAEYSSHTLLRWSVHTGDQTTPDAGVQDTRTQTKIPCSHREGLILAHSSQRSTRKQEVSMCSSAQAGGTTSCKPSAENRGCLGMQDCKDNSTHKSRVSEWLCKPAACSWCKVKNGMREAGGWNLTSQGIMRKVSNKPSHGEMCLKKHESCWE